MSNKLVAVLIFLNILILLGFVWLFGALTGMNLRDDPRGAAASLRERLAPSATLPIHSSETAPATDAPAFAASGAVDRRDAYSPVPAIDALPQPDEDKRGFVDRSSKPDDTPGDPMSGRFEPLTERDAAYTAALHNLSRSDSGARNLPPKITAEAAMNQPVRGVAASDDHYNKVDVSTAKSNTGAGLSTVQQIELRAAEALSATPPADSAKPGKRKKRASEPNDNLLRSLQIESRERLNESRTVVVEAGDTLYTIAERAYGDGFQYPKVFSANPHLTDPDRIEVGDVLRVPL